MVYIVTGYRRSGTSVMMKALHEGGLTVLYQPGQEKIGAKPENGYIPNPSGLHEVGQAYYMNPVFLRRMPDESLIKILFDGLPSLPVRQKWSLNPEITYKVIWMLRDEQEIRMSCEQVDKHLRQVGVIENPKCWYPFDVFRPYREDDIEHVWNICHFRQDIEVIAVRFEALINDPIRQFRYLRECGIPIDIEKAASVIDKKHWRFRREDRSSDERHVHSGSQQRSYLCKLAG